MPIEFPLPPKDPPWNRPAILFKKAGAVPVPPNLALLGAPFTSATLNPGLPRQCNFKPSSWRPGTAYLNVRTTTVVNQVNKPTTDGRTFNRVLSWVRYLLSGVTRDGAGAALGLCRTMLFSTAGNLFLVETTSDASGNYTLYFGWGWPFFVNAYKTGLPDVAGTSLNNLVPDQT